MPIRLSILAVCLAMLLLCLPVAASAIGDQNAGDQNYQTFKIGIKIESVDNESSTLTGTLSCSPDHVGHTKQFNLGPYVNSELLTVGSLRGARVKIESGQPPTITEVFSMAPCEENFDNGEDNYGEKFDEDQGSGDPEKNHCGQVDKKLPQNPEEDFSSVQSFEEDKFQKPGKCGTNGKNLKKKFLNRVWKFSMAVDSYQDGQLSTTLEKVLNLPKKFKNQDDELLDQDTLVLVSSNVRVYKDKKRVSRSELEEAESVRVHGKMLPPGKWQEDQDGSKVPTVRAKKIYITE